MTVPSARQNSSRSSQRPTAHRSRSSKGSDIRDERPNSTSEAEPSVNLGEPSAEMAPSQSPEQSSQRQSSAGIDELKRKMEEALVFKQSKSQLESMRATTSGSSGEKNIALRRAAAERTSSITDSSPARAAGRALTASTDSTHTVKGPTDTPGDSQTPSYPFPRMKMRLPRGTSNMSLPSHRPFTLLSPTNVPSMRAAEQHFELKDTPTSDYSTAPPEVQLRPSRSPSPVADPRYPSPSLYDLILILSSEPGLNLWWSNVASILAELYGAERASLAVPGDATDLENVPWGQRATFNINGSESVESNFPASIPPSDVSFETHSEGVTPTAKRFEKSSNSRSAFSRQTSAHDKPPMEFRHSFTGLSGYHGSQANVARPAGPVRAVSTQSIASKEVMSTTRRLIPAEVEEKTSEDSDLASRQAQRQTKATTDEWSSDSQPQKLMVYPSPQPLELETDPLIVRTGVAKLLGRSRPLVLTRQYNEKYNDASLSDNTRLADDDQRRANQQRYFDRSSKVDEESFSRTSGRSNRSTRRRDLQSQNPFEEFEQAEPSPWSQSPAPSPAARPDPTESPFFVEAGRVDESAFSQQSPTYDYSEARPLEAIGFDHSKTLVHIPLIPFSSRVGHRPSDIRFPIAILSFLTPLTPYPFNLKRSLTNLLPHLACTYSNALHVSALEAQLNGSTTNRYGYGYGLGGTFSDENSELELVAELSGHIPQGPDDRGQYATSNDLQSPSEPPRESSSISYPGTPYLTRATYGLSPQPVTPGRTGTEVVDSYFLSKKQKVSTVQTPVNKQTGRRPPEAQTQKRGSTARTQRHISDDTPAKSKTQQIPSGNEATPKSRVIPKRHNNVSSPLGGAANTIEDEDITSSVSSVSAASATCYDPIDPSVQRQLSAASISAQIAPRALPDLISQILLNSLPLQLFLAKPKTGELVWTNAKFDAYRSQAQGRVRDPWQNMHNDDRTSLLEDWKRTLESGAQITCHVRVRRFNSDSDYRWFIFRASTLLSQSGQLLYWIGSFLDVHEQRVSEMKATEEQKARARDLKKITLANSIPQIIFEAVDDQGIVAANEQWHTFSGQRLDDALHLGFAKHVHRDDLKKCGMPALLYRDKPPQLQDVLDVLRDEQKEGSLTSADTSESSGSSNRTVQGVSMTPLPEKVAREPTLSKLVSKGIFVAEPDENGNFSYSTEIRLCSKGGEYRWFLVRLVKVESPVLNDGNATWYGTCTDIHDRKLLERDLNYANSLLNRQMESKTKFFANMSHEIRTPLNGILGSIPWLVESSLDNDQRRTLDTIQNSSNNLRELVDNILDVTKLEAGKMKMVHKWFHVRQLLEEVIDTLGSRAIDKGLELNYTVNLEVPSMVKGDPFRLRQILINLMGNAVKFTDHGEVFTHCSIHNSSSDLTTTEPHNLFLAFEVKDTGRGFCEEDLERLFQHFSQIEGSNVQNDAGSGLGLFLSKQLVEMHGGKMSASGNIGEGATFMFYVKIGTPSSTDHPKSPSAPKYEQKRPFASDPPSPTRAFEGRSSSIRSVNPSPGSSAKVVLSPGSPALVSSPSSVPSIQSTSYHPTDKSSHSSMVATPDSVKVDPAPQTERQIFSEMAMSVGPVVKRTISQELTGPDMPLESLHPTTYSIVVICPAQHARAAMKQHIEQVVPHSIAANVTTIASAEEWLAIVQGPTVPVFTHIVLDLRHTHDVLHFMRQIAASKSSIIPTLVIITDHYQKRDIGDQYRAMIKAGRKVYLVTKPVKPSIFAVIFDPAQQRNLSKDRNRDTAHSASQNFKNIAEQVKHAIGGFRFRVLLVEDSDVNRTVIVRYLRKVELNNDQAVDGQNGLDLLFSKAVDYYSLILCDIQMPIKNGYDTCRAIRQWEEANKRASIPIMALTANAMPEEKAAAASAGFTDYLTKPVDFNTLGTMMMALLDRRSPHVFLRDRPDRLGL